MRDIPCRHVIYGGVWSLFLCCHITYLSVFKFDYGYNMMVCSASGTYVCVCVHADLPLTSLYLYSSGALHWSVDSLVLQGGDSAL